MPPAYSGHQYWIGNFKMWLNGMLNQINQLPEGERRKQIRRRLEECVEFVENLEKDPRPDEELNLLLFSGHCADVEEECIAHV